MQTRSQKKNMGLSTRMVTRSQTSGVKMTIVDDAFDYLDNVNDEDYEYIEEEDEELNNIHRMKTRSQTSGKRQVIIDTDFVYNDDARDANWK